MVKSIVKSLGGYDVSVEVNNKTTHVVCGDDRRTMNVLRGISKGCWVVSVEWVSSKLVTWETLATQRPCGATSSHQIYESESCYLHMYMYVH